MQISIQLTLKIFILSTLNGTGEYISLLQVFFLCSLTHNCLHPPTTQAAAEADQESKAFFKQEHTKRSLHRSLKVLQVLLPNPPVRALAPACLCTLPPASLRVCCRVAASPAHDEYAHVHHLIIHAWAFRNALTPARQHGPLTRLRQPSESPQATPAFDPPPPPPPLPVP